MPVFLKRYTRIGTTAIYLLLSVCFWYIPAYAQLNDFANCRWEQGLPASNAYALLQDRQGYLWVGTENGLLRFNGYEFKRYKTQDGLPDNEILGVKEDAQGRIWVTPYTNAICYISKGKVHNAKNDPVLRQLQIKSRLLQISPDKAGNVWLLNEQHELVGFDANDNVRKITRIEDGLIHSSAIPTGLGIQDGHMYLIRGNRIYQWQDTALVQTSNLPLSISYPLSAQGVVFDMIQHQFWLCAVSGDKVRLGPAVRMPDLKNFRGLSTGDPGSLLRTSTEGIDVINSHTGQVTGSFLQGYNVGPVLQTKDGSWWFGTIGSGLARFFKTPVRSADDPGKQLTITYVKGAGSKVMYITDKYLLTQAELGTGKSTDTITRTVMQLSGHMNFIPCRYIGQNSRKQWVICDRLTKLYNTLGQEPVKEMKSLGDAKTVLEEDTRHLLIGTPAGLFRIDKDRFLVSDTLVWRERVVAVSKIAGVIYMGTINGLMAYYPGKLYRPVLDSLPDLQGRISALAADKDGRLLVANNKARLIVLDHDTLVATMDFSTRLHCNNIFCIKASRNFIWVGTDNGLLAITQTAPYTVVRHITYANGLSSNRVTCLDIDGSRIWVGTTNGLNYFDENAVFDKQEKPRIVINDISNGNVSLLPGKGVLPLTNAPLDIDFDVLDFSSGSRPVVQYRLDNNSWTDLKSNQLEFPTLPYGRFTLQIRTFSSNLPEGTMFAQVFHHPTPFYQNWWFVAAVALLVFLMTSLAFIYINRRVRKKQLEKLQVQQHLLRLEQMALQSQMNPHFIFNCIVAMKQYYHSGDKKQADQFADAFSLQIRQTFEMGTETFVTLDKELDYLSQYLRIEQARFNQAFQYRVTKKTVLPATELMVPTMLLQPMVENAVLHGVRHLPYGTGMISIDVSQTAGLIQVVIADNGIGREQSRQFRAFRPVTSSAVSEKRLRILNRLFDGKISMKITDEYNDKKEPAGTTVLITYPVYLNNLLKDESYYH